MTPAAVFGALGLAWTAIGLGPPPRAAILTLLAQWAHETGGGLASNNWNLAGIKHVNGDGHDFARYETFEVINGVSTKVEKEFRAYPSLDDAAFDWLRVLRRDFAFAWSAVEAGDPVDFAHRLKVQHYYTDTEEVYSAGLRAWFSQLDRQIPTDAAQAVAVLEVVKPLFVAPGPVPPEIDPAA